jgi:DNA-binding CsgD family transcriptional regulator
LLGSSARHGLAAELPLKLKTIETHQMRIKEKLGLHGAAELRQEGFALDI